MRCINWENCLHVDSFSDICHSDYEASHYCGVRKNLLDNKGIDWIAFAKEIIRALFFILAIMIVAILVLVR